MNSPNREEFEARLAELDARQSGRLDAIEAKLDALRDQVASFWRAVVERFEQLEARTGQLEARTAQLESQTARVETRLAGVEASLGEVRQYLRGLTITIIATGLSVVFGIAAINVSSMSNFLTAFATGKEAALAQARLQQ